MLKAQDNKPLFSRQQRGTVSMSQMYPQVFSSWPEETKKAHDAGFAFLTNKLAKLDPTLYKPLFNITYGKDIKGIEVGNELVDAIEYYSADYSGIMDTVNNMFGEKGSVIPRVTGGLMQGKLPVFNFEVAYDLSFVEVEKLSGKQLPISIEKVYQELVQTGFDLFANRVAYLGVGAQGGLFNHDSVEVNAIPTISAAAFRTTATDQQVLAVINGMFKYYFDQSNFNINIIPDTLLVPSFVATTLSDRISTMYTNTLYEFLLEHNLAKNTALVNGLTDFKLKIVARKQLDTLGGAGLGRFVLYRNDPMFVKFHIPFGFKSFFTGPNVEKMAYTTLWVAQVAQIQLPYNDSSEEFGAVSYWDFAT
jgi:hypothetical protein